MWNITCCGSGSYIIYYIVFFFIIIFCFFFFSFFFPLLLNNSKDIIELNAMTKSITSSPDSLTHSLARSLRVYCLCSMFIQCAAPNISHKCACRSAVGNENTLAQSLFTKPRQRKCLVNNFFSFSIVQSPLSG